MAKPPTPGLTKSLEAEDLEKCKSLEEDYIPILENDSEADAETQLLREAKIKKETSRARRAASDTQNYSAFSLFGGNNDALIEELKTPLYAINIVCPSEQNITDQCVTSFAGQITIRPHLEAMNRLEVDGQSIYCAGIRQTGNDPRRALAIMHALRVALAKAINNDGTSAKASDVVIFSDSMSALQRIENFTREGQCWGKPLLGRILFLANELSKVDVKLHLHWVPAHKGISGNYLADVLND